MHSGDSCFWKGLELVRGLAGLGSVSPNKMDMVALYYPIRKLFFDPTMVCKRSRTHLPCHLRWRRTKWKIIFGFLLGECRGQNGMRRVGVLGFSELLALSQRQMLYLRIFSRIAHRKSGCLRVKWLCWICHWRDWHRGSAFEQDLCRGGTVRCKGFACTIRCITWNPWTFTYFRRSLGNLAFQVAGGPGRTLVGHGLWGRQQCPSSLAQKSILRWHFEAESSKLIQGCNPNHG